VRVSILDDYLDTVRTLACFSRLTGHDVSVWTDHVDDLDVLVDRLATCEALVLIRERTPIRGELLRRLPELRLISQRSAYPHIDVDVCTELGIVVSSNPHGGTPSWSTAELTWGLIIAASRRIPQQAAALRAGTWQSGDVGHTLRGRRLGVYGYGRIGRAVAEYGRAFGMDVNVWASEASRVRAAVEQWTVAPSREDFFESSDIVTIHLRLVDATRGIIRRADLARMKPDAVFVNTSRDGLVERGALAAALRDGRPGMAAVDVFETEPVTQLDHPIIALPNVVATPHLGYVTVEEWELQFGDVFDQINAFDAGNPINVVNPEAIRV
jgi:D-3-phosphoglycerate dehydrogenase / 2-oxoglutarate reductase